uniref:Uncharacterized protein n=1 Tax=Pyrodinium bahamense TaxID=73915 RepID=A0A7S0A7D6_9DINO|mmetsp:Transcript_25496/g.70083  ORF Transcript_25496/g.70083 Transcript_25496/m.70083 type:complete len:187 (+) Transcript_25496:1-561(+)
MNKRVLVFSNRPQLWCGSDDNGDRDGDGAKGNGFSRSFVLPGRSGYSCNHQRVSWWHYAGDYLANTHYSYQQPSQLAGDCSFHTGAVVFEELGTAGGADRFKLTTVNHFLTAPLPRPELARAANFHSTCPESAEAAGKCASALRRALRCQSEWGHQVNILMVDFWTIGELVKMVDDLNTGSQSPGQ